MSDESHLPSTCGYVLVLKLWEQNLDHLCFVLQRWQSDLAKDHSRKMDRSSHDGQTFDDHRRQFRRIESDFRVWRTMLERTGPATRISHIVEEIGTVGREMEDLVKTDFKKESTGTQFQNMSGQRIEKHLRDLRSHLDAISDERIDLEAEKSQCGDRCVVCLTSSP